MVYTKRTGTGKAEVRNVLSKSESEFLENGGTGNHDYDAVLKFRVRRKLRKLGADMIVLNRNYEARQWLFQALQNFTEPRNGLPNAETHVENINHINKATFADNDRDQVVLRPGFDKGQSK